MANKWKGRKRAWWEISKLVDDSIDDLKSQDENKNREFPWKIDGGIDEFGIS